MTLGLAFQSMDCFSSVFLLFSLFSLLLIAHNESPGLSGFGAEDRDEIFNARRLVNIDQAIGGA